MPFLAQLFPYPSPGKLLWTARLGKGKERGMGKLGLSLNPHLPLSEARL